MSKNIFQTRELYKPFEYPEFESYHTKLMSAFWHPHEVSLDSDIKDFNFNVTKDEREVVTRILRNFVQSEIHVGCFWGDFVSDWFKKPEIQNVARFISGNECFDKETELLTKDGWKNVTELTMDDYIGQYNLQTEEISFVKPLKVVNYKYNGKMHHYLSSTTDICVTPNHDLILIHPQSKKVKKDHSENGKWGQNYQYPKAGKGTGGSALTALDRVIIAAQADANIRQSCPSVNKSQFIQFKLTKSRKIDRLRTLLTEAKLSFSEIKKQKETIFSCTLPDNIDPDKIKNFNCFNLNDFSYEMARDFIEELSNWDCSIKNNVYYYYNTDKLAVDKVQAISCLGGYSANVGINKTKHKALNSTLPQKTKPKNAKTCYLVYICDQKNRTYPYRKEIDYDDFVYCVSVPTQNIISRRNNKIAITGNTIHSFGYDYLNASLGLEEYHLLKDDKKLYARVENLINKRARTVDGKLKQIALYSVFGEGVALFSSFIILFSFTRKNLFKNMGQIISWSTLDEQLHSEIGCQLFNIVRKENSEIWTDELKEEINLICEKVVNTEMELIERVFEGIQTDVITKEAVQNYVKDKANKQLKKIGLNKKYKVDKELLKETDFFDIMVNGESQTDFFANKEVAYSKGAIVFDNKIWED